MADRSALQQILLNLVSNARDAMKGGGRLLIDVRRESLAQLYVQLHPDAAPGEYVCVSVSDTGTGMDEQTVSKVFDPFFTTKPEGQGTGLGMAMIHGLVKQHSGSIYVYSEPGRGTEVKVYLPLVKAVGTTEAPLEDSNNRGSETILLVEDNAALRRTAIRVLTGLGYSVIAAENGDEALTQLRDPELQIDLVLSDVVMPHRGGVALYEAVRNSGNQVRFLFASGYAARALELESGSAIPVPIIRKPWNTDELANRIREALDAEPEESWHDSAPGAGSRASEGSVPAPAGSRQW